jgi:hypothetical protein
VSILVTAIWVLSLARIQPVCEESGLCLPGLLLQ